MNLNSVKVFNAVKCGPDELMFLQDKDYELVLDGQLIYITSRKNGSKVVTSTANVPWMTVKEPEVKIAEETTGEQGPSSEDIKGATKAKNKRAKVADTQLP